MIQGSLNEVWAASPVTDATPCSPVCADPRPVLPPSPYAATWANVGACRGRRPARAGRGISRPPLTPSPDRGLDRPGSRASPFRPRGGPCPPGATGECGERGDKGTKGTLRRGTAGGRRAGAPSARPSQPSRGGAGRRAVRAEGDTARRARGHGRGEEDQGRRGQRGKDGGRRAWAGGGARRSGEQVGS
jgi:hypothetical protein